MNYESLKKIISGISDIMTENRDYLVSLDQQNGDGDLGISMASGYEAVKNYVNEAEERDLGKLLMKCGSVFNEAAPSSLGTITSFGFMGMAKALKGKEDASFEECIDALDAGLNKIMEKAKSKPGEKTILDSLHPAIEALKANKDKDKVEALKAAAEAAAQGSENTKNMRSVHGRAAYYAEKSIGTLDVGSVVGKLILEAIYKSY
ncbi:MAG: dihydroxyacetone kinase subunit L [Clostridiales bacterium]|nr:dihydroxyacetone kinase subunit L [Clostridiales bacterium]